MAEATEAQLRAEALVNSLWTDGELGAKIQAKAKEKFADVRTTDEQFAPVIAPLKAQNDALAAELKAMREERKAESDAREERKADRQKQSFEAAIAKARDEYSLTDEGFDKMVARMKETGNYTDPDAAAAWVASKNPPPAPTTTFGPQNLDLFGSAKADERMAALHRDPQRYMDDQLSEFVANPDKYVRETLGA